MGKRTLTIQYFDGSVEELPLDGKKSTWVFARGKGIEKMQLDGESFPIALEAIGDRVLNERMAEFVTALIAAQLGRESKTRAINAGANRLSDYEVTWQRDTVAKANEMKKGDQSLKWKEIARRVGVPERTLRDWRKKYR